MHSINVEGLDIPWTSLTLGCMQLAPSKEWGDACSADEADRVVKAALEGGIKAFDTAGGVHLLVGKYSTEDPAEAAEIARREGVPWPPGAPKE